MDKSLPVVDLCVRSFLLESRCKTSRTLLHREVQKYLSSLMLFPFGIGIAVQDLQKKREKKRAPICFQKT